MGVESILDIPDDFALTERQRRACTSVQTGEPWFSAELGKELESLKYPIYFMDFESVNPAIPRFSGMSPLRSDFLFSGRCTCKRSLMLNPNTTNSWRPTAAIPDASSSRRCAVHWEKAAASLSTLRSNRSGSQNSQTGCLNLLSGSRRCRTDCGTCCLSFETTCTIPRSRGRIAEIRAACAGARV